MKKNKLLLLTALLMVGCSKPRHYPTILSQLEQAAPDKTMLERRLATTDSQKCFNDLMTVDHVKAEINELEKKYVAGTKVSGKWKHLTLEELPIPQANFLKTFGNRLGDLNNAEAFDYSTCSDVPCLINKVYQDKNPVAGYVHYLWYLKMGSYLAANNTMYGGNYRNISPGEYNGKKFPVSAYLWNELELKGFWKALHMMKPPYTNLQDLKEINRVPRGEEYGFLGSATCGLAWNTGWISLQDDCMKSESSFLESLVHELTHQIDYQEGKKFRERKRSKQPDYLKVSRFAYEEYVEDGKTKEKWTQLPDFKEPSWYGATSGVENFAETLALYRLSGSELKSKIHDDHFEFASKNYYSDKDFGNESLMHNWLVTLAPVTTQLAFQVVGDCSASKQTYASSYLKKTDLGVPVSTSMLNCLGAKSAEVSKSIQSKVKSSEPDGCRILDAYSLRNAWEPVFKPHLATLLTKYLKELNQDKEYFAKVQAFYDEINDKTMAADSYLTCYQEADEQSCYAKGVLALAMKKLMPLNLPAEHVDELAGLYLSSHPFSDTKQYLISTYRAFVSSHSEITRQAASELWNSCSALSQNDEASPTGKHFTISEGYMVSSLYNCLNLQFPDTAKLIVRDLSVNGFQVQHPTEELLLYQEVVPELQRSLHQIYAAQKMSEDKAIKKYVENHEGLRKQVVSDFSWVNDVLDNSAIINQCQKLAISKIDFEVLYHQKSQAFLKLAEDACVDIHKSPEYNSWLEQSKSFFEGKSLEGLQNKIVQLATERAEQCVVKYPMDTNLQRVKFKKEREACLLGEWPEIENKAIKEFASDPLVVKFKIDPLELKSKLEPNRRRHQLRIIKEYF